MLALTILISVINDNNGDDAVVLWLSIYKSIDICFRDILNCKPIQ